MAILPGYYKSLSSFSSANLSISLSSLSLHNPNTIQTTKPFTVRMGGGPRTFPGGVSKWQWKRMQNKKAKQLLKARLMRERQIYEMRKRAELKAAVSELERPWQAVEQVAPNLFSVAADEQLKVLADRFQKPGGFDLWSEKDGPQLFETPDGLPTARFFPKGVVHSIKPYGRVELDDDSENTEDEIDDFGVNNGGRLNGCSISGFDRSFSESDDSDEERSYPSNSRVFTGVNRRQSSDRPREDNNWESSYSSNNRASIGVNRRQSNGRPHEDNNWESSYSLNSRASTGVNRRQSSGRPYEDSNWESSYSSNSRASTGVNRRQSSGRPREDSNGESSYPSNSRASTGVNRRQSSGRPREDSNWESSYSSNSRASTGYNRRQSSGRPREDNNGVSSYSSNSRASNGVNNRQRSNNQRRSGSSSGRFSETADSNVQSSYSSNSRVFRKIGSGSDPEGDSRKIGSRKKVGTGSSNGAIKFPDSRQSASNGREQRNSYRPQIDGYNRFRQDNRVDKRRYSSHGQDVYDLSLERDGSYSLDSS